jgi:hypothetical protein
MVSHIKRSRTAVYQNPCDNFLYGVKGTAYGRAGRGAMWPKWGSRAEGCQ